MTGISLDTSSMHLSRCIKWNHLLQNLMENKTAVMLSVGACGKIHIENKKDQLKISNRSYITEADICSEYTRSPDRCLTVSSKSFGKKSQDRLNINKVRRTVRDQEGMLLFVESLIGSIKEFADTADTACTDKIRANKTLDVSFLSEYPYHRRRWRGNDRVMGDHSDLSKWPKAGSSEDSCHGGKAIALADVVKKLLWDNRMDQIFALLNNKIGFEHLLCANTCQSSTEGLFRAGYNVMMCYLHINLMIVNGYRFSSEFVRFITSKRNYAHQHCYTEFDGILDVLNQYSLEEDMKSNMDALTELSKACFRYLYLSQVLFKEIGVYEWINNIAGLLSNSLGLKMFSRTIYNPNWQSSAWLGRVGHDEYEIVFN